jgi:CubicO group peptidase (beta-lactamase class C family)
MTRGVSTDPLPPLPAQPAGVPWPTQDWPTGPLPAWADAGAIEALVAEAFEGPQDGPLGVTHAVVAVQGGRLVFERYAPGCEPPATCRSWSMAKSITQALVGLAVAEGRLDIHEPAPVAAWRTPGDPRGAITLDHLLRMSSGLAWVEDYVQGHASDVVEMLFGAGQGDMAAYAAAKPLAHAPGSFFYYSSGTTNIVSAIVADAVGARGEAFLAFMRERLFTPLGMASPAPRFDGAGVFIGSSFCFCAPRDFARFGLFCLRDGIWEDRRLLPEGWIDYARTRTFQQPGGEIDGPYGAHWWLDRWGPGSFAAAGYEGQFIVLRPDLDLVVVRNGVTPYESREAGETWVRRFVAAFG